MEILDAQGPSSGAHRKLHDILQNGYSFSIGTAINEGFDIFKKQIGAFVGYTAIVVLIGLVSSGLVVVSLILSGPLTAGFLIMAHHIKTGQRQDFNVFFDGFKQVGPLILYSVVSFLIVALGFILLVLPGIYIAVAYSLALMLIVFRNLPFWEAMEWSRKIVTRNWWKVFAFVIVLVFLNLAGVVAFGIGVLFTIPISYCASYSMFMQITKGSGTAGEEEANTGESPDAGRYQR
jgi:uncharacterized membrane protein